MPGKISEDTLQTSPADAALLPIVEGGTNKATTVGALRGRGYATSSNSSGNTTITVGAQHGFHLEVTTVTGSGSTTRIAILALTNTPATGCVVYHRCILPATAAITLEWRNSTSGGTLLTSFQTDGSGDDIVAELYFDGSAWKFLKFTSPA